MIRVLESHAPSDSIPIRFSFCFARARIDMEPVSKLGPETEAKVAAFIKKLNRCDIWLFIGPLLYIPAFLVILLLLLSFSWLLSCTSVYKKYNGFRGLLARVWEWPARAVFRGRERTVVENRKELLPEFVTKTYFEGKTFRQVHGELIRVRRQTFPQIRLHAPQFGYEVRKWYRNGSSDALL